MNGNGNRRWENHLRVLASESNVAARNKVQQNLNNYRRDRVYDACLSRPVFIPLRFQMTAAATVIPYRQTTDSLGYDVIITGMKSSSATREIIFRRNDDDSEIALFGGEADLRLRLDDISGSTQAIQPASQPGVFYFPTPMQLPQGNRITIEMFKEDVTADPEQVDIVLVGERVYDRSLALAMIDPDERDRIERYLAFRPTPATRYLKQLVEFNSAVAGGEARNLLTPRDDEPLLVRGVRTTLANSLVEISVSGEANWSIGQVPVWGVMAESDLANDSYQWFQKPLFLPTHAQISLTRVVNGIDIFSGNGPLDPQTDNTVTWICETV